MKACYRSVVHRKARKAKEKLSLRRRRKILKQTKRPCRVNRPLTQPVLHEITQIKDLKIVLKDFERFVKEPRFLRVGRELSNFSLRPREAWANWLLCAVANHEDGGENITFSTDPTGGDGLIRNKKSGHLMLTEHVFAPSMKSVISEAAEDQFFRAIEHKVKRGADYAREKHLVVFSEAIGTWSPNRLARRIAGTHGFISVWALALKECGDEGYIYNVTELDVTKGDAPIWEVKIGSAFDEWGVDRIQ